MNRNEIARKLTAAAAELMAGKDITGAGGLSRRLDSAERLIRAGGRGLELGVREIDQLARGAASLFKEMRKLQWDISESTNPRKIQQELLEALENAK